MSHEIIRKLAAWDADNASSWILEPGTVLSECRILRNNAPGTEPYLMGFESAGHRYSCPLFAFQARTQVRAATETQPADPTVTL